MDNVDKVIEILKKDLNQNILDFRVTYTHKGVKVNISYVSYSGRQQKPFPNIKLALVNALTTYVEYLHNRINGAKEMMEIGNPTQIACAYDENELLIKHLPNANKALEYVKQI